MVQAWWRVFCSDSPSDGYPTSLAFQYPFKSAVDEVMLLFPLDGYYLTKKHHAALQDALSAIDEPMFYVSTYEGEGKFLDSPDVRGDAVHYTVNRDDPYETYQQAVPWPLENALYSSSGNWGLMVSHEMHGVLGGSKRFIEVFKSSYQLWRADVAALKYYWHENPNRGWLDNLLPRIEDGLELEPAEHPEDD